MSDQDDQLEDFGQLITAILQLDTLEKKIKPLLPALSRKLVSDLLESGCEAKRLARVIGRSPGYVLAIKGGERSLTVDTFIKLVRHAYASQGPNA